jgi:ATP-dependent phosphofructokinase / diphosphate-dependent phosphofructokinase
MQKTLGILVGGGPAPGINGAIASVTVTASFHGLKVLGIRRGYEQLIQGNVTQLDELTPERVARIHKDGGSVLQTSRANPKKTKEGLDNTVKSLLDLGVDYLVTIGGDDTSSSAEAVARAAGGRIKVGHVPKTIDNDLPLPDQYPTFGFHTAQEVGTQITETLMTDAYATSRWYLVVAMGRKAGHLALGIGTSAAAPLTLIPEEISNKITLVTLCDIIVGSILKRHAAGQQNGVVVLAEGLAEKLDESSIPEIQNAERDPHGHVRYAELDFAGIIKRALKERLAQFGLGSLTVVEKNVGYELRCAPPISFDQEYTRVLGYGLVDFLMSGGTEAMISRQRDNLVPIPFSEMVDPSTGKVRVRFVNTSSGIYKTVRRYMTRMTPADLKNDQLLSAISRITGATPDFLRAELADAAKYSAD